MKTIQYGIEDETGLIISRVNNEVAWPILQYQDMMPSNNFKFTYKLEKFSVFSIMLNNITWTKKISNRIKNIHREFWGFKLLS